MAKLILWFFVVVGFLISAVNGGDIDIYTKIVILSMLGILALCESIEKGLKR